MIWNIFVMQRLKIHAQFTYHEQGDVVRVQQGTEWAMTRARETGVAIAYNNIFGGVSLGV